MRAPKLVWLLIVGSVLVPLPIKAQDAADRAREVRRLETELSLAKSPAFYLALDLEARKIELKARGMVLRDWALDEIHQSGSRAAEGVYSILKKAARFIPTRLKITPEKEGEEQIVKPDESKAKENGQVKAEAGQPATETYDLQALEIRDMPSSFDLILDSGLTIQCRPHKKGLAAILAKTGRALYLPLKTLVLAVKKKRLDIIELSTKDSKEAQALYWTVFEGQKLFILTN